MSRYGGALLHITSLPDRYGIGTLGKTAFEFVDFLSASGLKLWQVLPVSPAGSGNSPYKPYSSNAGNPLLIDFEELSGFGLIDGDELKQYEGEPRGRIDYHHVKEYKTRLLKKARQNGIFKKEQQRFFKQHSSWLKDYALFMSVKEVYGGVPWFEWDYEIRSRNPETMKRLRSELKDYIDYYCFEQMLFYRQWKKLKEYANFRGVYIIGDVPIYVSEDSADVWAHPELFMLDAGFLPVSVAGCPPDCFCAEGQLWGNPLYDWEAHEKTGFLWWRRRLNRAKELFNIIRIDHFRGFEAFWAVPFGEETARNGHWMPGPGYKFFKSVKRTGSLKVIAEDLGFLTPDVIRLRDRCGFPGMKVLQFAFDSGADNAYLPHNHERNCAVYTGTHDNDTVFGWEKSASREEVEYALRYLNCGSVCELPWAFIRGAWASVGRYAIAPMQDFLCLDTNARMNTPGTPTGNWDWQMHSGCLTDNLSRRIYELSDCYGRL
ncbi:MAG: 4-alpha-glucanotransferase [Clostridiales bacterium]|nr:4-alpha-glucanotransferase [Clostridiales bacterium]